MEIESLEQSLLEKGKQSNFHQINYNVFGIITIMGMEIRIDRKLSFNRLNRSDFDWIETGRQRFFEEKLNATVNQ